MIGQAADQARVNEPGELDRRHMTRMRVETADIPDRLLRQRKVIGQESAAVLLRKETVESPQAVRLGADVEQVDHQEIAGLRTLDADRTAQKMNDREVDVSHVVGRIVVINDVPTEIIGVMPSSFEPQVVAPRAQLWQPDQWPDRAGLASPSEMLVDHARPKDMTVPQMERHLQESYSKNLY